MELKAHKLMEKQAIAFPEDITQLARSGVEDNRML